MYYYTPRATPSSTVLWNSPHFKENNHHYSLVQCREEFNQRSSFVTQPRKDNTKHYGKHDQTNDVHSSRGRHSCRYSARTCLDLSSYGGNVYGTIVMDADNFLASLEVNIIACDIVSLRSCGYCNVVCFFLFTRKKDTECLLIIALEKMQRSWDDRTKRLDSNTGPAPVWQFLSRGVSPPWCVCVCHVYVPRVLDVFVEKMGIAHKQSSGHRISYFKVFPRSSKILRERSTSSRNEGLCGILNARAI